MNFMIFEEHRVHIAEHVRTVAYLDYVFVRKPDDTYIVLKDRTGRLKSPMSRADMNEFLITKI